MVTGINGCICDNCIQQAYSIMESQMQSQSNKKDNDKGLKQKRIPKPAKIKEYLDQYVIGQDEAKKYLSVAVYNQ